MAFDEEAKREDGAQTASKDAVGAAFTVPSVQEGVLGPDADEVAGGGTSCGEADADGSSPMPARKKKGVLPLVVLLVVFLSGAIGGAGYLLWQKLGADHITSQEVSAGDAGNGVQEEAPKVRNP